MKSIYVSIIFLLFATNFYYTLADDTRNITVLNNPFCDKDTCKNETYLVYVKATGPQDTLHVLYSPIGAFTIMLFKTDLTSNLAINWTNLLSYNETTIYKSITFTNTPTESSAFTFQKIYEFNDSKGDADLTKIPNNSSYWVVRDTANMIWTFNNDTSNSKIGIFEGRDLNKTINGTFKFNLRYYGKKQRDKSLPHLLVSSDSTSIDFIIDSVTPAFKDSKFAINVLYSNNLHNIDLKNKKSLDDEYTPGTFQQWTAEASDDSSKVHSYLQWKPIFYFYKVLTLENSTQTKQYKLSDKQTLPISIASAYFDGSIAQYTAFNISFGLEGNEKDAYFYPQSNYSSWTFMTGIGEPALEKMSSIVTLVIFIGFGLPGLVIVVGIFVMLVRKCKNSNREGYEEL